MIPIFRAKKMGSDEWVEGNYSEHFKFTCMIDEGNFITDTTGYVYEIDPSTLQISFDGETFRSMEEMKDALAIWDKYFEEKNR